jgi:hypothetical protein
MSSLPSALIVIGSVLGFIAGIWLLVVAFRQSILWGLACLLIPFVSLLFVIVHWSEARSPFLLSLLALVPIILGVVLGGDTLIRS